MADASEVPTQDPPHTMEDGEMDVQVSSQQEPPERRRSGNSMEGRDKVPREQSVEDQAFNNENGAHEGSPQRDIHGKNFVEENIDDQGFNNYNLEDQDIDEQNQGPRDRSFRDHDREDDQGPPIRPPDRSNRLTGMFDRPNQQHHRDRPRQVIPDSPEPLPEALARKPKLPKPVQPPTGGLMQKLKKKPGPKPSSKQPITMKDTAAKKALIREIEGHWGKDFIKNYIPKVHRPLTKRKKGKARTHNRRHDDNPNNWLPSVLTCILSLAKKIDDKDRLKKLMGDVVRMRNQHTGNKKPQLVTTDFDVIEDVLDHKWTVAMAFNIRYKHLLNNRLDRNTDSREATEYYKDLFHKTDSEDESSVEDLEDEEYELQNELADNYQPQSGYYNIPPPQYGSHMRGYEQWQQPMHGRGQPPMYRHQPPGYDQPHGSYPPLVAQPNTGGFGRGQGPPSGMHGYANSPLAPPPNRGGLGRGQGDPRGGPVAQTPARGRPVDDYGQPYRTPSSLGNSDAPDPYAGNGHRRNSGFSRDHAHSQRGNDRDDFREPERRPRSSMGNGNVSDHMRTSVENPRNSRTERYQSIESSPDTPLAHVARPRSNGSMLPPPAARAPSPLPVIKAEPRDDDEFNFNDSRGPRNDFSTSTPKNRDDRDRDDRDHRNRDTMMVDDGDGGAAGGSSDAEEELRAQLALAEATAQAAKLRLKVLSAKSKRRSSGMDRNARSGTAFNPMSLDD